MFSLGLYGKVFLTSKFSFLIKENMQNPQPVMRFTEYYDKTEAWRETFDT